MCPFFNLRFKRIISSQNAKWLSEIYKNESQQQDFQKDKKLHKIYTEYDENDNNTNNL